MGRIIKDGVKKGFSLVELSIVMSIIGLLVGGVLAGQSLINGQRKNAILTKAQQFRVAVRQFKLKYSYLPGDFPTATQVWGRADGGTPITANCATPWSDNANPNGTCNGDGNESIGVGGSEQTRAWQQLKFAGFIEGTYNGLFPWPLVIGTNVPASPENPNAYYNFGAGYGNVLVNDWYHYDGNYADAIMYGTSSNAVSLTGGGPALPGEEAYWIDAKIDDGLPATGIVRGYKTTAQPNCTTGGQYDRSQKTDVCGLIFMGVNVQK